MKPMTSLPRIGAPKTQDNMSQIRATHNPIPPGDEGVATLRAMSECPIPEESKRMNDLLQQLVKDPSSNEHIEQLLANGMAAALRANTYCRNNMQSRVVVKFDADPELDKMHKKFLEMEREVMELTNRMDILKHQVMEVLQARWIYSVKTYGLDVEKYSYRIDEDRGCIEQVNLHCPECKGVVKLRKARQETAELLAAAVQQQKVEVSNDGERVESPCGHIEPAGENSPQE